MTPFKEPKSPQETPRIDVKKDISINEKIKKKTASFSELYTKKKESSFKMMNLNESNFLSHKPIVVHDQIN